MKKLHVLFVVVALVLINLSLAPFSNAQINNEPGNEKLKKNKRPIPNRYIVVFNEEVVRVNDDLPSRSKEEIVGRVSNELASRHGGNIKKLYKNALKGFAVEMSAQQAERLSADPRVKYVEEDAIMYASETQTNAPWNLDRIDQRNLPLDTTYNYDTTGAGVHAYVMDSGIRSTHVEFAGRLGNGADFVGDGQNGNDCNGHGTHVAGILGGATYGVAKRVILHNLRVLGCDGSGASSDLIEAVDWVMANRVNPAVVNLSLGFEGIVTSVNDSITNSIAQGVHYAVAAGNANIDACNVSPARVPAVVTVGASDRNDARSLFANGRGSNFGPCLDLFAPGSSITAAVHTSDTETVVKWGTSMATPHVAGAIAKYLQANPAASPATVENALKTSATAGVITDPGPGSPNLLLYSPPGTTVPPNPTPSTPTNVVANVVSSSQINVFWNQSPASENVTSYNLRVNSTNVIRGITYLSYPVKGLAPNTTYTFEVQAVNSSGVTSNWSTPVSATTLASQGPNAPTRVVTQVVSTSQINVFWDASTSPNVTSYNLRINGGNVITGITYLSYPVKGLAPNTTYTFEVQAVNSSGVASNWSAPVSATTPSGDQPNAPPRVVTQVVSSSQINVFWDASTSPNVTSYNLRINGANVITGITYLSYPVRGLAPNTTYTFEVQAVNSSGVASNWSAPVSATTPSGDLPNAPARVVTQVVSSSQINVFWDASTSPNVTSYNLRINGGNVITGITYLSYPVRGLNAGTTYTFEVQAVNSAGAASAWSAPVSATTTPADQPNAPPRVVTQVVSSSQINVFWDASTSPNVTSYNLRVNGANVISGITYLSYPVKGLAPNTTYTFEVQAVNSSGVASNWSAPVSATTGSSSAAATASVDETTARFMGYDSITREKGRGSGNGGLASLINGAQGSLIIGGNPPLTDWLQFLVTGNAVSSAGAAASTGD